MKKTALYEVHTNAGAKLIEFAGYMMPVSYRGIIAEHLKVRSSVGVFDVSHMGEIEFRGEKALEMIQKVTVNDASKLEEYQVQYSAMCYNDGGIVDDLLVYRFPDKYLMVVNASNKEKDYNWIIENKINGVKIEDVSDSISLIAVQGPSSIKTLQKLTDVDLDQIKYYHCTEGVLADKDVVLSRTGYTGEIGYEIFTQFADSEYVWNKVIEAGKEFDVEPIGLGARDSLRLEKKYCLYGNDITKDTNPLEAGLGWITKFEKSNFIGKEALLKIKEKGIKRKLIGYLVEGKSFPRKGYKILKNGEIIGETTSGIFSPSLQKGIGMGHVKKEYSDTGSVFDVVIRGKNVKAEVVKTPFI
ncbi:glycine cleavage system aminomethyltransferase GcvT [candidate division KSB1 bacterium]